MKKTTIIEDLHGRLDKLEMWQKEESEGKKEEKKKTDEDENACPKCGGDLDFVEDGIVFCPKCREFYEEEEQ